MRSGEGVLVGRRIVQYWACLSFELEEFLFGLMDDWIRSHGRGLELVLQCSHSMVDQSYGGFKQNPSHCSSCQRLWYGFLSGLWIISSSYLYEGGSWLILIGSLVICMVGLLLLHHWLDFLDHRAVAAKSQVHDDDCGKVDTEVDFSERMAETLTC